MFGLNIHLQSFKLNPDLYGRNDKFRVSVTTLPEQEKDAVIIEAKKMNYIHHFFSINITEQTKKIIFVFRKKSLFSKDPIIASTIIMAKDLPSANNSANREIKSFYIYEPVQNGNRNRRIFGELQIQFSLTDPFPINNSENNFNIGRIFKGEGYSQVSLFQKDTNENSYYDNSLFVDADIN